MYKSFVFLTLILIVGETFVSSCLITNCPRGGKRSGKMNMLETNIKQCISCGPGRTGQCFGPNICCGPFGCLVGTTETIKCQREGLFHEPEPCIAGSASCKKHTGRCAADGICCDQESCHSDKSCLFEDKMPKNFMPLDIYGIMSYQNQAEYQTDK